MDDREPDHIQRSDLIGCGGAGWPLGCGLLLPILLGVGLLAYVRCATPPQSPPGRSLLDGDWAAVGVTTLTRESRDTGVWYLAQGFDVPGVFAEGPAEYLFDARGTLVTWTADSSDYRPKGLERHLGDRVRVAPDRDVTLAEALAECGVAAASGR